MNTNIPFLVLVVYSSTLFLSIFLYSRDVPVLGLLVGKPVPSAFLRARQILEGRQLLLIMCNVFNVYKL